MMDEEDGWAWQREVLDWWLENDRTLILKARQLGITWVAAALALWYLLFKPGSRVLVYSIGEDEAKQVARRIWIMYQSLPPVLRKHVKVLKPHKSEIPSEEIILQHSEGVNSSLRALSSTMAAGHGEVAALIILDEFAYNPNAVAIWKATQPAMSGGGKTIVISTANGVAGNFEGSNFFYHLWANSEDRRIATKFLGWQKHPERDEEWYQQNAMSLPTRERAESFPSTAEEAWIGTGESWFDTDAMAWYQKNAVRNPLRRFTFIPQGEGETALVKESETGLIKVFQEVEKEKQYAIGVDPAGGTGLDYSTAYVIDLHSMALCAEMRSSLIDPDEFATQLHFLGKMFNDARIAIERTGGYGAVIITALRDGRGGRPPYPRIYRHRDQIRPDIREEPRYGFPTTSATRPQLVSGIEIAIREKALPWLTQDLYLECKTFGAHRTLNGTPIRPSPSAAPGCNDDCVIACAIALELYRQYGQSPISQRVKSRRRFKKKKLTTQPWLRA